MNDRIKYFEAALAEKMPDTTLEELSTSLRQELSILTNYIEEGSGLNPFAANVLKDILGCSLEEFIDLGREFRDSNQTSLATATTDQTPILVEKARAILQDGGPDAATLQHLLNLLRP